LPDNVDTEHVEAKLENGELIVKVPKVEQPEKAGRIINVQ
jgi:HSP20 family molecular chaperone IbpA